MEERRKEREKDVNEWMEERKKGKGKKERKGEMEGKQN